MDQGNGRRSLIAILRLAYSGERAAAFAYQGHASSVTDAAEREHIRKIEAEEWHHRELVGGILARLGSRPAGWREIKAWWIGKTLGLLCHVSGWFLPMYGAGRLERRNIAEYEAAARHARDAGLNGLIDCLLTMAEVEWEHERYFRERVLGHRFARVVRMWQAPPPKAAIRAAFETPAPVGIPRPAALHA